MSKPTATFPGAVWDGTAGDRTNFATDVQSPDQTDYDRIVVELQATQQAILDLDADSVSPLTALGDILYGGVAGADTRLAGNIATTKKVLTQTGTGTASAAPAWGVLNAADVSAATDDHDHDGDYVPVPAEPVTATDVAAVADAVAKTAIEQIQNILITAGMMVDHA